MGDPRKQMLDGVRFLLCKDRFHARKCSREDSNLHGSPHTVLSRTVLPVPPREREKRETIGESRVVKGKSAEGGGGRSQRGREDAEGNFLPQRHGEHGV